MSLNASRWDSRANLFASSYEEAIDKYEAVMKTEPNVPFYTNLAKERICFSLVKVRQKQQRPLNAAFMDPFTGWPTCT